MKLILKNKEEHFGLKELSGILPERWNYETIRRWCVDGVELEGGRTIFLECIDGPAGRRSSIEAYYRFLAAIQE